jgi:dihydrofolate reductase
VAGAAEDRLLDDPHRGRRQRPAGHRGGARGGREAQAAAGGDLAVGGAGLAASFTRQGLIDEYRLFISPVVLGGGTPYFPALDERIGLELLETRTFGSRVVYLRYQRT